MGPLISKIIQRVGLLLGLLALLVTSAPALTPGQRMLLLQGTPNWAQGSSLWYNYATKQGSQALGFPPATDTHSSAINSNFLQGNYQSFAANVPVLTNLGLQTTPTRTNSLRNNSMVGAAAGTPGTLPTNWTYDADAGVTRTIVGTGTENGLPYIDIQLVAASTASTFTNVLYETTTSTTAASGETWTSSFFYKLIAGATGAATVANSIYERTSLGVFVAAGTSVFTPTTTMQRSTFTRTLSGGATIARLNSALGLTYSVGVAFDFTIRIYAPQLEGNNVSFASPPILTTNAAVTVNGNLPIIGGMAPLLMPGVSGLVQFNALADPGAGFGRVFQMSNGVPANVEAIELYYGGGNLNFVVITGSAFVASLNLGAWQTGIQTVAFSVGNNYAQAQRVGSSAPTADTSLTVPSGLDRIGLGNNAISNNDNQFQFTRKIALFPGSQSASTFADIFAKAQQMAASP